jgi:hypothetical protein
MAALTKEELDAEAAAHRAWCAERAPVEPFNKAVPSEPMLSERDRALAAALERRVEQMEQRLAEVERKGYVGVWKADREYSPQSEVTHDGARWFAHKRTSDRPGTSADWQLMEKSLLTSSPRSEATATASARQNGHYARPRTP